MPSATIDTKPAVTLARGRLLTTEGPVRQTRRHVASGALGLGLLASLAAAPAWARPAPESFAELAAEVSPAVVNIQVEQRARASHPSGMEREGGPASPFDENAPLRDFMERFFGQPLPSPSPRDGQQSPGRPAMGVGSGFIIDPEGYIVTNHHVIDEAAKVVVTLSDGSELDAELVGSDPRSDLALLKVEPEDRLPSVSFGDSDRIRPGDWVMAVGNPFGLGGTVTAGIVSARGRDLPGGALIDYLQLDAPINRGNSGGPSFDTDGKVIGVNTAIYSPNGGSVGIGFAIPSNLASEIVADLRDDGRVERGWLGVQIQPVNPDIAEGLGLDEAEGALIASLVEDGPAEAAGFQPGDVILRWDGQPVGELKDLPRLVAATPIDREVEVEIWRDRGGETLTVTTGRMPEPERLATAPSDRGEKDSPRPGLAALPGTGLTVATLDGRARDRFGLPGDATGVVVTEVEPDSQAADQGIRPGDIIASIALDDVETAEAALDAVERLQDEESSVATLMILRDGNQRFVALRLAQV